MNPRLATADRLHVVCHMFQKLCEGIIQNELITNTGCPHSGAFYIGHGGHTGIFKEAQAMLICSLVQICVRQLGLSN